MPVTSTVTEIELMVGVPLTTGVGGALLGEVPLAVLNGPAFADARSGAFPFVAMAMK
jgi:hypothetical protein